MAWEYDDEVREDGDVHVYPLFGREHDTENGDACWCGPEVSVLCVVCDGGEDGCEACSGGHTEDIGDGRDRMIRHACPDCELYSGCVCGGADDPVEIRS